MSLLRSIIACLTVTVLGLAMVGCRSPKSVTALGGGYEEVSHPSRNYILLSEPEPPRTAFQYRNADGTITPIWPSLYGVAEVIKGKVAIFVGDKAYINPDKVTHPRLFAVKSPELPMDITDEVLREWSTATGRNFKTAQDRFNEVTPEEKNGDLALRLDFSSTQDLTRQDTWPAQSILRLTWSQVGDLMQNFKAAGVQKKDLRWDTPYIGEKP
jgi:hypothetical protein